MKPEFNYDYFEGEMPTWLAIVVWGSLIAMIFAPIVLALTQR